MSNKEKALGQIPNTTKKKKEKENGESIYLLKCSGLTLTSLKATRLGKSRHLRSRISGGAGYSLHLLRTTSRSPAGFVGSDRLSILPVSPISPADYLYGALH